MIAVKAGTNNHGKDEVRATDFLIHDVDPYEVLQSMTRMFDLRLQKAALVGTQIRIVRRDDMPEQA